MSFGGFEEAIDSLVKRADRSYDIPLNVAVWISFKPIIKIYLSIGTGFLLAKTHVLTPELSKGISRLVLIVFMPCLIFNNIVSQIKDTDIKVFGVVVFTGFIYYCIGLGWGLIVSLISPIPRAWFGGLLLCCMLNNCSDLPLAYVQTIGNSPLLPSDVASRGVSYCVLMVIVFTIFNFNLGGTRLVEWDATRVDPHRGEPSVPLVSWASVKHAFNTLRKRATPHQLHSNKSNDDNSPGGSSSVKAPSDLEAQQPEHQHGQTEDDDNGSSNEAHVPYTADSHYETLRRSSTTTTQSQLRAQRERPFGSTEVFYAHTPRGAPITDAGFADAPSDFYMDADSPVAYQNLALQLSRTRSRSLAAASLRSRRRSDASTVAVGSLSSMKGENDNDETDEDMHKNKFSAAWQRQWNKFRKHWFHFKEKNRVTTYICNFFEDIFLPQMLALIAGITVAMIPWVRRVFVKGQEIGGFHDAPDQMPPLSFLMDFLSFFAAAQVPLGLMLLGGTIASLRVGKMVKGFWKSLILIVMFKLALLPIIACGWIHRIREIGWVEKSDPIIPIVLAVGSGTPSATVQIYLTLSWIDPNSESVELNCLALALMAQYALLPITMTFLMTYVIMHFV